MMQLTAQLPYYEDLYVRVVKLPYVTDFGDKMEMVIILPRIPFDLSGIRRKMTGKVLQDYMKNAVPMKVEVGEQIPLSKRMNNILLDDCLMNSKLTIFFIFIFPSTNLFISHVETFTQPSPLKAFWLMGRNRCTKNK